MKTMKLRKNKKLRIALKKLNSIEAKWSIQVSSMKSAEYLKKHQSLKELLLSSQEEMISSFTVKYFTASQLNLITLH